MTRKPAKITSAATQAPASSPSRQLKALSTAKEKPASWIPDEASMLRGTIHTNNANIGHYTRRGDLGAASALRSQTAVLERQLQALEEAKEKARPKPKFKGTSGLTAS